jgi:hypothetical protein
MKMAVQSSLRLDVLKGLISARFSLFAFVLISVQILTLSLLLSNSGIIQVMAQQQHNIVTHVAFSSLASPPSSQINNNSSPTAIPAPSNNSLLYDNSTYGIKFQFPYGWNKIELLSGRIINVEFTSPSGNVTGGNQLPAGVVMSIENGLGNITTLGQYSDASNKLLHAILGNFSSTAPRNTTLSGLPAIVRVLDVKQPISGIHINIAQVFTIKDGKAYGITYTAPASKYFSYLPTVQHIITSFQITK